MTQSTIDYASIKFLESMLSNRWKQLKKKRDILFLQGDYEKYNLQRTEPVGYGYGVVFPKNLDEKGTMIKKQFIADTEEMDFIHIDQCNINSLYSSGYIKQREIGYLQSRIDTLLTFKLDLEMMKLQSKSSIELEYITKTLDKVEEYEEYNNRKYKSLMEEVPNCDDDINTYIKNLKQKYKYIVYDESLRHYDT